jgi:crotonobetainyl-CoA:carnitine CoA-transferase CaiB-like acyl-CoA transferase
MVAFLDGMRVLDLSAWRPMPHATQILADLGAEVLKVEPPGGDPMRSYPEIFASVARGKRSIVLDLRSEPGLAQALELAAEADVVCEGWRPGVAQRLGIDYESVAARNPAVIYCSLSGFGQNGPLRDTPGHDVNFQALAGAVAQRSSVDGPPRVPRLPAADLEGGTVCALLVCAAWARKLVSGEGEQIDVAMADVVAWWVGPRAHTVHDEPGRAERRGESPGYGVFETRDGAWIAIGVLAEQRLWDAVCRALQLDDLLGMTFPERLDRASEVNKAIADAVSELDATVALERFGVEGAPATAVLDPADAAVHPQFLARGLQVPTSAGVVPRVPAVFGGDFDAPAKIPAVGEHPEGFTPR